MIKILKLKKRFCPVCKSKKYKNFYKNSEYSKIDSNGNIYRYEHILVNCLNCNLIYSNPWLGYKNTNSIYRSSVIGSAFEESHKAKKHFHCFKSFFKSKNSFDKKKINILEIGTATGVLLKNISNYYNLKKKNLFGIEPSYQLYKNLKNNKYFKIENKFINNLTTNKKYDLIIMDNVLEHIEEPNKVLKKIKKLMRKDSMLYIAVPDVFKYKKNFRDPFGHTINYYENNIKYLFDLNEYKIIKFKKHFNYLNFIAKPKVNFEKKFNLNFKQDFKLKFKKVKSFIKKSLLAKKKEIIKYKKIEKKLKLEKSKIVLFGASNFALEFLDHTDLKKNILFLVDNNSIYHGKKRFGIKVHSPKKLKKINFDKVIITSKAFSLDIKKFLINLKIPLNKIITL